eukprot:scaffold143_cov260-Pinguiococcus_pyrenoidosus.AAC.39
MEIPPLFRSAGVFVADHWKSFSRVRARHFRRKSGQNHDFRIQSCGARGIRNVFDTTSSHLRRKRLSGCCPIGLGFAVPLLGALSSGNWDRDF